MANRQLASYDALSGRPLGRVRTSGAAVRTVHDSCCNGLVAPTPRRTAVGPAASLRGFGDLVLQVAGLMITAELAQRCLVQLK